MRKTARLRAAVRPGESQDPTRIYTADDARDFIPGGGIGCRRRGQGRRREVPERFHPRHRFAEGSLLQSGCCPKAGQGGDGKRRPHGVGAVCTYCRAVGGSASSLSVLYMLFIGVRSWHTASPAVRGSIACVAHSATRRATVPRRRSPRRFPITITALMLILVLIFAPHCREGVTGSS